LEEAIRRIAKAGYDGVALMGIRPHAYPPDFDKTERKNLLNFIKSLNLEVSSIVNYGNLMGVHLSSPNEKIRREAIEHQKNIIELAYDLECKSTLLIPGYLLEGESHYDDAWRWAVEGLKECATLAEERDVVIAIEPAFNLLNSVDKAIEMMEEIGSKNIRIGIDTLHLYRLKQPIKDSILKLRDKLAPTIHVWDVNAKGEHVPFGEGEFDFDEFMKTLKAIGFEGYLEVECMPFAFGISDRDKFARESRTFLERLLSKSD